MVFHVAARQFDFSTAFKFGEQIARFFTQGIDQHIQTASVRHTDNHLFHTVFTGILHQIVQCQDRTFSAFHAETFLADIFVLQITFQCLRSSQLLQDIEFLFGIIFRRRGNALEIITNPAALGAVGYMHVFNTNRTAISLLQFTQDFRQSQLLVLPAEISRAYIEFNRHILIRKAVEFRFQTFDMDRRFTFQGVQLRRTDTLNAVSGNQAQNTHLFFQHIFINSTHCNRTGFCQFDKRFLNGAVSHITFGKAWLSSQFGKILPPIFFHRIGIVQKFFIQLLNIWSV